MNRLIYHPTLSLILTAHEDRSIRFFDINSGKCIHSMIGHLDAVTALDLSPSGLVFTTGGEVFTNLIYSF